MARKPPRLTCLDHLPSDELRRCEIQLDEARRQAAEEWRKNFDAGPLERRRRELEAYEFSEVYQEQIGGDIPPWSRPEDGDSARRIDTARRWGRSPLMLFDLVPPRETPLQSPMILHPPSEATSKPLTKKQAKQAKARMAVYSLVERSREFARSWVVYRVAAKVVLFLKALDTDVNKKVRALRNTVLKHLSIDEARETVYQKYVKPDLPPEDLNASPLDHLPDDQHRDAMVKQAKATPRPDPAAYYHDLVTTIRELGYGPVRAGQIAREHVIADFGLDRIDANWARIWLEIEAEEKERGSLEQEDASEL